MSCEARLGGERYSMLCGGGGECYPPPPGFTRIAGFLLVNWNESRIEYGGSGKFFFNYGVNKHKVYERESRK